MEQIKRRSFVFYESYLEAVEDLEEAERGQVLSAIARYALYGEEPQIKGYLLSIFKACRPNIDNCNKRYLNGLRGGRPNGNQTITKPEPNPNQTETNPEPNENQNTTKPEPNPNQTETNPEPTPSNDVDVDVDVDVDKELKATTTTHNTVLAKKFLRACECTDTRESAGELANELQSRYGYFFDCGRISDDYKALPMWGQMLFSIYVQHPDIQPAFEVPLIKWQTQKLLSMFSTEQLRRAIEQVDNKLATAAKANRQLFAAIRSFAENDFRTKKTTKK